MTAASHQPLSQLPRLRNDGADTLSLDGVWDFAPQPHAAWQPIQVPGCWEAQGFAKELEGPVRYRRIFILPAGWSGREIWLEFDAVSYACRVEVNGVAAGSHRGLWTPFALRVTQLLRLGQSNRIEVEVTKPGAQFPVRECLAGFLPDVATTFGGLWQSVRLRAAGAGFAGLRLDSDPIHGALRIAAQALWFTPVKAPRVDVQVLRDGEQVAAGSFPIDEQGRCTAHLALPQVIPWSPERPALYRAELALWDGGCLLATAAEPIGFRRLATDGSQLLLNGHPIGLRGVLSWGWQPSRIAPWYSAEEARAEMRRVRALGFNLIKLCLFVPNPDYYRVADEEGMLLWQEWPLWLPTVTDRLRAEAPAEYGDYMALARHHPSLVIYSLGCELSSSVDQGLLGQLDAVARGAVDHVLFCDNSGSGEAYGGLSVDFADFTDYHTYGELHFLEPMLDHWRREWQRPRPWIFGEFCDADGFRDLAEIVAAHAGRRPWWMTAEIPVRTWRPEVRALLEQEQRLAEAGIERPAPALVEMARAQSLAVRKFTLESVRRRAAVKGYVITGLRDTPIATSGIFDDLGRSKWTPAELLPCNGEAILCLEGGRRRRWQRGGDRPDPLDLYNGWAGERRTYQLVAVTGAQPVPSDSQLIWRLMGPDGALCAGGEILLAEAPPPGGPAPLAALEIVFPPLAQAGRLTLEVAWQGEGLACTNQWSLGCYPRPVVWPVQVELYDPGYLLEAGEPGLPALRRLGSLAECSTDALLITTVLEPALWGRLRAGGRALLLQQGDGPLPARRLPFWREALKLFEPHPLWQRFPHPGYVDLQFLGLATDVALDTTALARLLPADAGLRPILRRLDAREFYLSDYLLEIRLGAGCLVACTLRCWGGAGAQPIGLEANVAGGHLFWSMVDYLAAI